MNFAYKNRVYNLGHSLLREQEILTILYDSLFYHHFKILAKRTRNTYFRSHKTDGDEKLTAPLKTPMQNDRGLDLNP